MPGLFSFRRPADDVVITATSPTFVTEQRAAAAQFAKRWEESERLWLEVIATGDRKGRALARNMLGKVYEQQKRVDEAIALYEGNLAERSDFVFYLRRLAVLYRRQGRSEDERRILTFAVKLLAKNPKASNWYSDRLKKMG